MRKFLFLLTGLVLLLSYAVVHAARSDVPIEKNLLEYDVTLPVSADANSLLLAIECGNSTAFMEPPDMNGYTVIIKYKLLSQNLDNSPLSRPIKQC